MRSLMKTTDTSAIGQRARRRRRAFAAVVCVFLGGASLGAAVGLNATRSPRRDYEKVFDSIGLTPTQRHATDSIMTHYTCAIDSINHTISPQLDSIRRLARQDVLEVLSQAQIDRLNQALSAGDPKQGPHRSDRHALCDHGGDSTGAGRSHFLRL